MNRKGQLDIGGIVILFIGIVFALALLTVIFDVQGEMTTKQVASNQSVSTVLAYTDANNVDEDVNFTAYTQSDWKAIECPLSSVAIRNGAGTALVADTDYTVYESQGVYSLLNTTKTIPGTALNLTYVDYTFCADGYNTDSGSRSIAGLIGLFAALALLGFVLEYSGVINMTNLFN